MSADPAALQLRLLQTVVEVAAEKNSTLVMPIPVELLRFFDRAARNVSPPAAEAEPAAVQAEPDRSLPAMPAMPALARPADLPANAALNAVPVNAPVNAVSLDTELKAPVTG
jgi:hypothetical protein